MPAPAGAPLERRAVREAAELWRKGRLAEARDLLRSHVLQHPRRWAVLGMLARIETQLGEFREAEAHARRSLALAPEAHRDTASVPLILLFNAQRRFPDAAAEIVRCLRGTPQFPRDSALTMLVAEALSELAWREDLAEPRTRILAALEEQPELAGGVRDQLKMWGVTN